MAAYKQRCALCKKNWALMRSGYQRFPICIDCEMKVIEKPIENQALAKMFDIPKEWYRENAFLRSVRYQYGRFDRLSDKQKEAFKKTIKELKQQKKALTKL